MFTESVSWEKISDMQSQEKLYSFLCDRVVGFHSNVMRRGSGSSSRAFFVFWVFFLKKEDF